MLPKFKKLDKEIILIFILSFCFFYKLFLSPSKIIFPAYDLLAEYYVSKLFFVNSLLNSYVFPLWNPLNFSGTSYIADPQSAIFSPFNILYLIFPVSFAFGINFFINNLLIGLFTYFFARIIKISKFSSLISAICMMFGGPFIILIFSGHSYISDAITWFPLFLYFIEKSLQSKKLLYGVLAGIPFTFMAVVGNFQIALYGFLTMCIYFIIRFLFLPNFKKYLRLLLIPGLVVVVSVFLLAVELFPIIEFILTSGRSGRVSYEFAANFSLPGKQLISFILPQFFGTNLNNSYWGMGNFWSLCGYFGILPLFFTCFAIFKKRNVYVLIFTFLLCFSFLFSLGKFGPLFPLFYKFVPVFNSFRVPARFLYIYGFSISILAGIGLDVFLRNKRNEKSIFSKIVIAVGVLLLLAGFFLKSFSGNVFMFNHFVLRNIYAVGINKTILFNNFILDFFVFSILIIGLGIILTLQKKKIPTLVLKTLILIMIIANLWFYWLNYYEVKNLGEIYKQIDVISVIKKDRTSFRVYDQTGFLTADLANTNIESVTGIGPQISLNYRQFFWLLGPHTETQFDGYIDISKIDNPNILRFLNVKYVITKSKFINNKDFKLTLKGKTYYLYSLENFIPRAYLVKNATTVNSFDTALSYLSNPDFNLKNKVIIESTKALPEGKQDYVELHTSYVTPNQIKISNFRSESGYLVLSQPSYPGWNAYDNGKKTQVYKGNGILTVIKISSGNHSILFKFEPQSFRVGKYLSILTIIVLFLLFYLKRGLFKN